MSIAFVYFYELGKPLLNVDIVDGQSGGRARLVFHRSD